MGLHFMCVCARARVCVGKGGGEGGGKEYGNA